MQTAPGPGRTGPDITAADLRTRLYAYADDSMMGRETGTVGNMMATRYIESEVRRLGLEPAGENGTYFQESHATSARFAGGPPGTARNVIAIVRGSDPVLRDEFVAIQINSVLFPEQNRRPGQVWSIGKFHAALGQLSGVILEQKNKHRVS
jgi:hypothetical protein